MIPLLITFLWGVLLGGAFHGWRSVPVKRLPLMIAWGGLGAVCFFIATAIFLYYLNQGQAGLYGFPVMIGGFFFYQLVLERPLASLTRKPRLVIKRLCLRLSSVFCGLGRIVLFPLALFLELGEFFWALLEKPYHFYLCRKRFRAERREERRQQKKEKREKRRQKRRAEEVLEKGAKQ